MLNLRKVLAYIFSTSLLAFETNKEQALEETS